ncbi:MAG: efflux RND transporter permease subunit [Bacteroidales bacterium]|nr:efflux RND transporter permease subunit [Bacteroidales bacterium]
MWNSIATSILRYKHIILIVIGIITVFMGFQMKNLSMKYSAAQLLNESDTAYLRFLDFKKTFGEDASMVAVAFEDKDFITLDKYNDLVQLQDSMKNIIGVKSILSYTNAVSLMKDTVEKRFGINKIFDPAPKTQAELDSMFQLVKDFKFYDNLLYTPDNCYVMAITCDPQTIVCKDLDQLVAGIKTAVYGYAERHNIKVHVSGLPYIRSSSMKMIKDEMVNFAILSLVIVALIFMIFFRSIKTTLWSVVIVFVGVIWTMAFMALFGYQLTMMSGMLPPLLIVIGIPNTIYLLNKYHVMYRETGDKEKSLFEVITKVGKATFLTNLTTAAGFATFLVTGNAMLMEFGLVATLGIITMFLLSVLMVPSIFSYVAAPTEKELKHLDTKLVTNIVEKFAYLVENKRKLIFICTVAVVAVSIYGLTLMRNESFQVDDLPEHNVIYSDLKYFEKELNGILPLEISIDTKRKKGLLNMKTIKKLEAIEDTLKHFNCLSNGTSIADALKLVRRAYYNGNNEYFSLPMETELPFMMDYLKGNQQQKGAINVMTAMVDSTFSRARIQLRIADVGTIRMVQITDSIANIIESYFPAEKKNEVDITGTSVIFAKGSVKLLENLLQSLILAIILISLCMMGLFSNWRMVIISVIPNFIPLIVTAAIMGYFGIRLKSSTILVFNIAFGISVDNAIHLFTKFRQAIDHNNGDVHKSVMEALRETGVSIIYSALILLCGFLMFCGSQFGGTIALGLLISITLFVAMFTNLLFLPSLLLTFKLKFNSKKDEAIEEK